MRIGMPAEAAYPRDRPDDASEPPQRVAVALPLPGEWPPGRTWADVDPSILVGRPISEITLDGVPIGGTGLTITSAEAIDGGQRLWVVAEGGTASSGGGATMTTGT